MSELILYQNRILMESNKNVEALANLNNSRDDIVDQVTTLESLVKVRLLLLEQKSNPTMIRVSASFFELLFFENLTSQTP